ncbi:MAG: tripartite tricarboxylate transporter TctB family protein [Lachnospiraceae bacterium]|nr:tripartite tricarboxylate transporter TctB family protein [Lachnospiraceae bacterium]
MIGNFILSAVLLILSGYILTESASFPNLGGSTFAGPGFFPSLCAGFFIFGAVVILIMEIYRIVTVREGDKTYVQMEMEKVSAVWARIKGNVVGVARMVALPVLMFAYGRLLKVWGFEISTFLFLVLGMLVCGQRKIKYLIIVPLVALVIVYLIFIRFLHVSIPTMFL